MQTVIKFTCPYLGLMLFALILMLSELFVDMYAPILMKNIIDNGILQNDIGYIQTYLLIMLGISLIAFFAGVLNSFISSHVCHMFSYDLRNAIFRKIQGFAENTQPV